MKRIILLSLSITLLTGCSGVQRIGKVGNVEFYSVHSSRFCGPNWNAAVVRDCESGAVAVDQFASGPGIGGAALTAAGIVGGAEVLGHSFPKPVGDSVNVANNSKPIAVGNSAQLNSVVNSPSSTFVPPGHINNPGHGH